MLCIVAAVLAWYVPLRIEKLGHDELEERGNSLAILLADSFGEELENQEPKPTEEGIGAVQTLEDVVFVAALSDSGTVVSIIKQFSSDSSRTALLALTPAASRNTVYTSSVPLYYGDGSMGSLVLGLSKESSSEYADTVRIIFQGLGAFLFLLSINIVVVAFRMNAARARLMEESDRAMSEHEMRKTAEENYQKLSEERKQNEVEESSRNKHIERKTVTPLTIDGDEPVNETIAREKVEEALDSYSRRLEALNDIAVSALRSVHQECVANGSGP